MWRVDPTMDKECSEIVNFTSKHSNTKAVNYYVVLLYESET